MNNERGILEALTIDNIKSQDLRNLRILDKPEETWIELVDKISPFHSFRELKIWNLWKLERREVKLLLEPERITKLVRTLCEALREDENDDIQARTTLLSQILEQVLRDEEWPKETVEAVWQKGTETAPLVVKNLLRKLPIKDEEDIGCNNPKKKPDWTRLSGKMAKPLLMSENKADRERGIALLALMQPEKVEDARVEKKGLSR